MANFSRAYHSEARTIKTLQEDINENITKQKRGSMIRWLCGEDFEYDREIDTG